tara:strand:+ start:1599 stop:1778 length:180 start_codon:yes stop_codon:yes gene_type:complete
MKKYILTIEYNEKTEEVEYLTEEIIDDLPSFYYGDIVLDEYWDDETIEILKDVYIIGES